MPEIINKVSSKAVEKATGKSWDEWIHIIDKEGGKKLTHKEIARLLYDKKYIKSGWWCQMVTVGYEHAKGRRIVGETKTSGFEIGVRKTFPVSVKQAWEFLNSSKGLAIWLGKSIQGKLEKGSTFQTEEKITGEIRTIKSEERVRITWQQQGRKEKPTTLQITILPSNGKSVVAFHHENLASSKERDEMRKRWQEVLIKLSEELI